MPTELRAVEATAVVDEQGQLRLDAPLRAIGPGRVRVIVLAADATEELTARTDPSLDPEEREWLRAASGNPAFAFLSDPAEDVYSPTDGRPFHQR